MTSWCCARRKDLYSLVRKTKKPHPSLLRLARKPRLLESPDPMGYALGWLLS
jgi:hypothetical protein